MTLPNGEILQVSPIHYWLLDAVVGRLVLSHCIYSHKTGVQLSVDLQCGCSEECTPSRATYLEGSQSKSHDYRQLRPLARLLGTPHAPKPNSISVRERSKGRVFLLRCPICPRAGRQLLHTAPEKWERLGRNFFLRRKCSSTVGSFHAWSE
jgi:hypothetical protein